MRHTLAPLSVVASHLGVSTRTIERWIKAGELKGYLAPSGKRWVSVQAAIEVEARKRSKPRERQQERLARLFAPEGEAAGQAGPQTPATA